MSNRHILVRARQLGYFLIPVLALALVGCSSSDDTADDDGASCYPLDPMLAYTPPFLPICEWPDGGLPAPPDGYEYTNSVAVLFVPSEDEACDPCDAERFDALLEEQIERECDMPYAELQRGCYSPPDESGAGPGQYCRVFGIYASDCVPQHD